MPHVFFSARLPSQAPYTQGISESYLVVSSWHEFVASKHIFLGFLFLGCLKDQHHLSGLGILPGWAGEVGVWGAWAFWPAGRSRIASMTWFDQALNVGLTTLLYIKPPGFSPSGNCAASGNQANVSILWAQSGEASGGLDVMSG